MSPRIRIAVISSVTFILGLSIGWLRLPRQSEKNSAFIPNSTTGVSKSQPANTDSENVPENTSRRPQAKDFGNSTAVEKLGALSWFKDNGLHNVVVEVFDREGLNPAFVKFFGLNEAEQKALATVNTNAKQKYLEQVRRAAKIIATPSNDDLVIEIPAQPEVGGQIYDEMLLTLKTVLGSERYSYFDKLCGDRFEHTFDSFGARQKKYELHRSPDKTGDWIFDLKLSYNDVSSNINGWTGSRGDIRMLSEDFPEIAKTLPAAFVRPIAK